MLIPTVNTEGASFKKGSGYRVVHYGLNFVVILFIKACTQPHNTEATPSVTAQPRPNAQLQPFRRPSRGGLRVEMRSIQLFGGAD